MKWICVVTTVHLLLIHNHNFDVLSRVLGDKGLRCFGQRICGGDEGLQIHLSSGYKVDSVTVTAGCESNSALFTQCQFVLAKHTRSDTEITPNVELLGCQRKQRDRGQWFPQPCLDTWITVSVFTRAINKQGFVQVPPGFRIVTAICAQISAPLASMATSTP
jgi:hypothetical protein